MKKMKRGSNRLVKVRRLDAYYESRYNAVL